MTVDSKILQAIEDAVRANGQSEALARLVAAWFHAIASGNEDINDKQSANRHLELLYGETKTDGELIGATVASASNTPTDAKDIS